MSTSSSDRVIYARNPLAEVICQLRFPGILKIGAPAGADDLARFQDRIRSEYPLLNDRSAAIAPGVSLELLKAVGLAGVVSHEFVSADEEHKVVIGRDSIAVATLAYVRWELFREKLMVALDAFRDLYSPAFFSRIGLRYRNQIERESLGLDGQNWASLLAPQVAGPLASSHVPGVVERSAGEVGLRLTESDVATLRFGTVALESGQQAFMIDNDFFTDRKTEVSDASEVLDRLHARSGTVFRWCIGDRLHAAMEPQPVV